MADGSQIRSDAPSKEHLQAPAWTPPVVTMADIERAHAERVARTPALASLEAFVASTLEAAAVMDNPIPTLRAAAVFVQAKLRALSAYARLPDDDDTPCPDDIKGVSALDLSDAMDRLNEAARRFERRAA